MEFDAFLLLWHPAKYEYAMTIIHTYPTIASLWHPAKYEYAMTARYSVAIVDILWHPAKYEYAMTLQLRIFVSKLSLLCATTTARHESEIKDTKIESSLLNLSFLSFVSEMRKILAVLTCKRMASRKIIRESKRITALYCQ